MDQSGPFAQAAAFLLAPNGTWSMWVMPRGASTYKWRISSAEVGFTCPERGGTSNAPYTYHLLNWDGIRVLPFFERQNEEIRNKDGKVVWSHRDLIDDCPTPVLRSPPPRGH
ncbi:hypothetical protein HYH03_006946 [Edaphochlamys debaryana]|uniref:Uncharacterized protein n=1 Tax=Edaphochlamys debaryana TaxID=47281 RepID=A0A836C0Y0_9CHLO|nr:hypothetical protein HYH03_006946 [Edaphochlamys debaryana]|eukprot:KAG2495013.1 hypothetical protein HYH03_006946 [Edaphochlamys debaryana]